MLEHLGLTDEASAVYLAMLTEPTWSLADLVARLRVPERVVRKALDQLADLKLLESSTSGDQRLALVSPDQGLNDLLANAEDALRQHQLRLEQTRARVTAIAEESKARRDEGSGLIRYDDVVAIRARLQDLSTSARSEICSFSPGGAHRPDAMEDSKRLNHEILKRHVTIRAVYQDAYRNDADTLAYAQWLTTEGGQLRTVPALPMQLIIVDREIAIVPVSPTEPRLGALEIRDLGVVATIAALFEQTWQSATPFGQAPIVGETGLTPLERQVLRMLSDGATDEMAARRLGVSVRTLRRTIADLTERLQATSRFQAGVNAGRAGWL